MSKLWQILANACLYGFLLWLLVPFFDKETDGPGRGRLFQVIGILVIVYILILTALAYTSK